MKTTLPNYGKKRFDESLQEPAERSVDSFHGFWESNFGRVIKDVNKIRSYPGLSLR
jgi:hypothetical protein